MINREERRSMGMSKETADKLNQLQSPCTVIEAVQLAQGVAKDAVDNYHKGINPLIVSLSLQVELIKEILMQSNLVTEEDYKERLQKMIDKFNEDKAEMMKEYEEKFKQAQQEEPKTDMKPQPLEIVKSN